MGNIFLQHFVRLGNQQELGSISSGNEQNFLSNSAVSGWDYLGMDDNGADFSGLVQEFSEIAARHCPKCGYIGVKSKCETCCGLTGIAATTSLTAAHTLGVLQCGFNLLCQVEIRVAFAAALTNIRDFVNGCKSSCPDPDCCD